jgi:enoyl-CoA hydratase
MAKDHSETGIRTGDATKQAALHSVDLEVDGAVAIVRINRPEKKNAIDSASHVRLGGIWREIEEMYDVKAVVITGAGETFSAGGDFKFIDVLRDDLAIRRRQMWEAGRLLKEMVAFPLPLIAAVNGPAIGLGASLALAADLIVMGRDAYLSDPHVKVGLVAADGGVQLWPHCLPMAKVKELLLFGTRLSAEEALRFGVVNRVVDNDQVFEEAMTLARQVAALPFAAVQDTKRALNLHIAVSPGALTEFAFAAQSESYLAWNNFLADDRNKGAE